MKKKICEVQELLRIEDSEFLCRVIVEVIFQFAKLRKIEPFEIANRVQGIVIAERMIRKGGAAK